MKNIESKLIESRKYKPDIKFSENSNLSQDDLKKLHASYQKNPDQFWANLGYEEIKWIKKFKSICEGDAPFYEWFKDGKLNVSENCIDRHINKNKDAIIHITEDNKKKVLT